MKKINYLFLLTPALFLASCQTTPKIDTLTEEEAIKIIQERFHLGEQGQPGFVAPTSETKIRWNIKSNEDVAKSYIGLYIFDNPSTQTFPEGSECNITDGTRLNNYVTELNDVFSYGKDAVIGMNMDIYKKMRNTYSFTSNDVKPYYLVYKLNGEGLIIISKATQSYYTDTRTHYYDKDGRETRFDVEIDKEDHHYTMTIEFKYSL